MAMAISCILHHNSFWCVFTLYWILIGNIQGRQLCKNWNETTTQVNLQMDTSPITGQNGMCSCRMTVDNTSKVSMFADIQAPNCNTNITLVDSSFIFTCENGKIALPYYKNHTAGDILWLVVSTTVTSNQNLSGTLQIKTESTSGGSNPKFTIECYDPNTNSSSPTTSTTSTTTIQPTTTTDEGTTTTSVPATDIISTSSKSATDSPTTTTKTTSVDTTSKQQKTTPGHPTAGPSSTTGGTSSIISSSDASTGHTTKESTDGKSSPGQSQSYSPTSGTSPGAATDRSTSDDGTPFPLPAVVGGVAGGLVLILIIVIAVTCSRRKHKQKEPQLLENGQGSNNNGRSYLNNTYEDEDPMTDNRLYQPGNYHYDNSTDDPKPDKNGDTIQPQTSPPVSSSPPADTDGGHYATANELPVSSNVRDHYASVDEAPLGQPGGFGGPVASQEVIVSPSGDIYSVVNKTQTVSSDASHVKQPDSVDAQIVSVAEDMNQPRQEVSPSGDVYAVVDKSNQRRVSEDVPNSLDDTDFHSVEPGKDNPELDSLSDGVPDVNTAVDQSNERKMSLEADSDSHSTGSKQDNHRPDSSDDDGDVNAVEDNTNQKKVSFEESGRLGVLEDTEADPDGHGGDHSNPAGPVEDGEEVAALNMMEAVSEEAVESDEEPDLSGSHDDTPIIQSTAL